MAVTRRGAREAVENISRNDGSKTSSMDVGNEVGDNRSGDSSVSEDDEDPDERLGVRIRDVIDDPEERVILMQDYHSSILGGHFWGS